MARLLNISPDDYHALPGFSASCAKTLIAQSPLHAWQEHPEYGAKGKKATKLMDRGQAIHTFLLGKGKRLARLPYDDRRTNAAKDAVAKARADGLVPLLHEEYADYEAAAKAIRTRLDSAGHFISDAVGVSECAIEWEEPSPHGPVRCRCMMDYVVLDTGEIDELKVVGDASPAQVERSSEGMLYRIAAAAYVRALAAYRPDLIGRITYRFLFVEPTPPYAIYDPPPDDLFLETGERDWLRAVASWAKCKAENHWPSYEGAGRISRPKWALIKEGYNVNEL